MKIDKLVIDDKIFKRNLEFYFMLKYLVKTNLTKKQLAELTEILTLRQKAPLEATIFALNEYIEAMTSPAKAMAFANVVTLIKQKTDIELLLFALKLYSIKDLLLAEAKLKAVIKQEELTKLDPLSLEYDNQSVMMPYATRVNGALLALLFFSKLEDGESTMLSQDAANFIKSLAQLALSLKKDGIEPNQMFMLMFSESINQSIISDSGSNYEDRIRSVLETIGIPAASIKKTHDGADKSTEYDFFFELEGKSYGIGAKRTLRERYKQFIKTAHMSTIDVMIEITLGLDLNDAKAATITSQGTIIFVADEIYQARPSLQSLKGVYSVKDLTLATLKKL